MKKVLLVGAFLLGISAVSFAQGRGRMDPAQQVAQMKTSLSLTDDQATKITAILTAQTKSMDSLRTAANGDMGSVREKMTPLRAAATAKIKTVLTADQNAAYDKQQAEMRARFQQGGGGN